eukprot:scaffold3437_cov113-Cylindrotheca_fusiformis.AAC.24
MRSARKRSQQDDASDKKSSSSSLHQQQHQQQQQQQSTDQSEEEQQYASDAMEEDISPMSQAATAASPNPTFSFGGGMVANCLTRELRNLPTHNQTEVAQDLYGIADHPTLAHQFEPSVYQALEHQIGLLPDKAAYELAESQSYDFVHDSSFQIMFLRATLGDVKKSAKRIVRHFKIKLDLFGPQKLVQRITLKDFENDPDDWEALESGGFQVLKKRDRAGRSVLFGRYTSFRYKRPANMLRTLWYMWMTLLEDETNQIKGVTAVGYEVGRNPLERYDRKSKPAAASSAASATNASSTTSSPMKGDEEEEEEEEEAEHFSFEMSSHGHGGFDRELSKQITTIPLAVPVRPVSYHLCTDSDQWVATLNMVIATICKFMRLRMRLHHGTYVLFLRCYYTQTVGLALPTYYCNCYCYCFCCCY